MEVAFIIIGVLCIIIGLIGCFVPVLPGPPIAYISLLLLQIGPEVPFSFKFMLIMAGIVAVVTLLDLSDPQRALIVIAIASGATVLSHVNDSGFWLVGKYFGMNEKQTLQSWTVMETIIGVCGLIFTLIAGLFV